MKNNGLYPPYLFVCFKTLLEAGRSRYNFVAVKMIPRSGDSHYNTDMGSAMLPTC